MSSVFRQRRCLRCRTNRWDLLVISRKDLDLSLWLSVDDSFNGDPMNNGLFLLELIDHQSRSHNTFCMNKSCLVGTAFWRLSADEVKGRRLTRILNLRE